MSGNQKPMENTLVLCIICGDGEHTDGACSYCGREDAPAASPSAAGEQAEASPQVPPPMASLPISGLAVVHGREGQQ